jgi:hypothetical protein
MICWSSENAKYNTDSEQMYCYYVAAFKYKIESFNIDGELFRIYL